MNTKRSFLRTICGSVWSTPIVISVALPAHATMSGMNFSFSISYTEQVFLLTDEIITLNPPQQEEQIFEVSDEQIQSGVFSIGLDLDGSGFAADFVFYNFIITESSSTSFSGNAERGSVDIPELLRGNFEASKI